MPRGDATPLTDTERRAMALARESEDFEKRLYCEVCLWHTDQQYARLFPSDPSNTAAGTTVTTVVNNSTPPKSASQRFLWRDYPRLYRLLLQATNGYLRRWYHKHLPHQYPKNSRHTDVLRFRHALVTELEKIVEQHGLVLPIPLSQLHDKVRQYFNSQIQSCRARILKQLKLQTCSAATTNNQIPSLETVLEGLMRERHRPWRPLTGQEPMPVDIVRDQEDGPVQKQTNSSLLLNTTAAAATTTKTDDLPAWKQRALVPQAGSLAHALWKRLAVDGVQSSSSTANNDAVFWQARVRVRYARGHLRSALFVGLERLRRAYRQADGTSECAHHHKILGPLWCWWAQQILDLGPRCHHKDHPNNHHLEYLRKLVQQLLRHIMRTCPLAGNHSALVDMGRRLLMQQKKRPSLSAAFASSENSTIGTTKSATSIATASSEGCWSDEDIYFLATLESVAPSGDDDPVSTEQITEHLKLAIRELPKSVAPHPERYFWVVRTQPPAAAPPKSEIPSVVVQATLKVPKPTESSDKATTVVKVPSPKPSGMPESSTVDKATVVKVPSPQPPEMAESSTVDKATVVKVPSPKPPEMAESSSLDKKRVMAERVPSHQDDKTFPATPHKRPRLDTKTPPARTPIPRMFCDVERVCGECSEPFPSERGDERLCQQCTPPRPPS